MGIPSCIQTSPCTHHQLHSNKIEEWTTTMQTCESWWRWRLVKIANLLVDELSTSMETTGGDISWINGNNSRHSRIIHNIVIEGLLGSNKHENKWWCVADTSTEVHEWKIQSVLDNTSPHFVCYGQKTVIHELRTSYPKNSYDRTQ